jgi:hypothetical protein
MAELEKALLAALASAPGGVVDDSGALATQLGCEHLALVGCIKSLLAHEMILSEVTLPAAPHVKRQPGPEWGRPAAQHNGRQCQIIDKRDLILAQLPSGRLTQPQRVPAKRRAGRKEAMVLCRVGWLDG